VIVLAGIAIGGAGAGAILFARYAARAQPDPNRVVVAPFDVFVPGLEGWRVGLAQALTERLPGAVPQTVVAQRWRASIHPAIAAVELGRRVRAGVAVYGRVDPLPEDSIWVRVAVMDPTAGRLLFQLETRDRSGTPNPFADSLAARIRRRLS
jgi:hypothetical protein